MFDGQIGNAAPRIETIRFRKGCGGAGIETGAATAAAVVDGRIGGQVERREDRTEKQPRTEIARHQIGMLALPAEARACRQRLFHHRRGIDKDFHLAAGIGHEPARDILEPRLDQFVVVVTLGVNRNARFARFVENGERIVVGPVIHAEHDDGAHIGPQCIRRAAPFRGRLHPHHVAMQAVGEKAFEPRLGLGHGVGFGDADRIEAAQLCLRA